MHLAQQMTCHTLFNQREMDYIRWYPKSLVPAILPNTLNFKNTDLEGIYIHIPFCDQLCGFCPYNKRSSSADMIEDFVQMLIKEIQLYGHSIDKSNLRFIYFGGGTPTVLTSGQFDRILNAINSHFVLSADLEICVEGHPSHFTKPYLKDLQSLNVSRVSTGIQAFDDATLKALGSYHTAEQAVAAIHAAEDVFGDIAIDLLFRIQGQSVSDWKRQLDTALQYQAIKHYSLYSLVLSDDSKQPSLADEAAMTEIMLKTFSEAGFHHYASCASGGFDICLPGYESMYECRHWEAPQAEFLGLGPGALGYVANATTVNGLSIPRYMSELQNDRLPLVSIHTATTEEQMHRFFVLGVKVLCVDLLSFEAMFGIHPRQRFQPVFDALISHGFADITDTHLTLTAIGRCFVDTISTMFFSTSEAAVPHPEEPEIKAAENFVIKHL